MKKEPSIWGILERKVFHGNYNVALNCVVDSYDVVGFDETGYAKGRF